jgi:hypothetical protein
VKEALEAAAAAHPNKTWRAELRACAAAEPFDARAAYLTAMVAGYAASKLGAVEAADACDVCVALLEMT